MVQDPVCNMEVDNQNTEFTSLYEGRTIQFCSQECKDKFDRNPQQYAKAA